MTHKTLIILYNGVETNLEINLNEINSYESLMNQIHPIITDYSPEMTYNLMAINSSEPYTILEHDNYMKILNEEIKGENLKLFLNKINLDSIQKEDEPPSAENINNPPPPPLVVNIADINEDDEDDDFIIEKDEEKMEEKKEDEKINNILIDNKDKKPKNNIDENKKFNNIDENININNINNNDNENIIYNDNDDIEDPNNDLYDQTNIMLEKIQKVMGRQDLEIYKHSKTINEPSLNKNINKNNNVINENNPMNFIYKENEDNFNLILDSKDNKNNQNNIMNNQNKIEDNQLTPDFINPETFKSIKCSICQENLSGIMYICCVCENCTLCDDCEMDHFHPCIKYKTPFLSNLKDIYKFMTSFYQFKTISTNFFSKLFRKEYELSIIPLTDKKISLRPEKELLLPIKIINLSKDYIKSSQIEIIPKDNQYVQFYVENKKVTLMQNSPYTLKMNCITGNRTGKEKIIFYCFSEEIYFKNPEKLNFTLEFEVNNDVEEENLNKKLDNYDNVIVYNKEHKQIAVDIMESIGDKDRSIEHLNRVFNILIKYNWNKEKSINIIKSLKK